MHVVFWVIFIGLCINTGAILTSFLVSLFVNPAGAKDLYLDLNLSELHGYSLRHYMSVVSLLLASSALKAYIAYLVVRIFLRFNFTKPFDPAVSSLISRISEVALGTGVLGIVANGYTQWLVKKDVAVPIQWESEEFLFLAGVIFIIAQVFKKGIDIQTENELTV